MDEWELRQQQLDDQRQRREELAEAALERRRAEEHALREQERELEYDRMERFERDQLLDERDRRLWWFERVIRLFLGRRSSGRRRRR